LIQDSAGNLYSTTAWDGPYGYGVVFMMDTSGAETVLYNFTGGDDGGRPEAGLIQDTAGNLYGTTLYGGSSNYGVVFKVDANGAETVLHSFTGSPDGAYPLGGLIQDSKGNLYGTTSTGGSLNIGTVFKLTTSGTETVLHSFAGGSADGQYPDFTGLLMDKAGNIYGVTEQGGGSSAGVLYKLNAKGKLKVLHAFTGGPTDGFYPDGSLVMDTEGNLYGTATSGGSADDGIVWKVGKKGAETVLHSFTGYPSDGAYPNSGVILDAKGNLYFDTEQGGTSNYGTVYEMNKKGALALLHSFSFNDGGNPFGGLMRDAKGNFYGTTYEGGGNEDGTVWKLTP
jgi:uncharacterized repeat protein (TIGR03803 family)